jgi:hypothetical protein
MRVLFYYSNTEWSGGARVFASVAAALVDRYQVTFVCAEGSLVERRLANSPFEVVSLATDDSGFVQSWRLRKVLTENFVEVVFVHTDREHLVAAGAMRLAERGAVLRRIGAGVRLDSQFAGRTASTLAATGFIFADAVERERAQLPKRVFEPVVADLGVPVEKYDDVRPVPRNALVGAGAGRVIVCVMDETSSSRAPTVLRTLAMLTPRHQDLRLVMMGNGSDSEDLRMHAASLGIGAVVKFLGDRDDQLSVLRAADIGWVIADGDNAAYAYLDLMALRIPVLAERSMLAQHYVADGITGQLLSPGDAAATAAIVASLLGHDERRLAMGNAARVRVAREFTEKEMVASFESAIAAARDRSRWGM